MPTVQTRTALTPRQLAKISRLYPICSSMPRLATAQFIVTGLGHAGASLRVPTALLREAGVEPKAGLKIELVGRLVLIRQGTLATGQLPDAHSQSVLLSGSSSQTVLDAAAFAALVGEGYLLLGSLHDLVLYSPGTRQVPYRKPGKPPKLAPTAAPLEMDLTGLLAWKDVNSFQTRKLYDARSVRLEHGLWALSGFKDEDWLHVQRFSNATVLARGAKEGAYTQLLADGLSHDRLRLYAGPYLFDLGTVRTVRVLVFDKKLVLVNLDHPLALACPPELAMPHMHQLAGLMRAHIDRQNTVLAAEAVRATEKPARALPEPRASYQLREGQRIQLQGAWLREPGFTPGTRYEVSHSEDAPGALLLRPAKSGDYGVTAMGEEPKLYVPAKHVSGLRGASVDVVVLKRGVLVIPRTEAAQSHGSRGRAQVKEVAFA